MHVSYKTWHDKNRLPTVDELKQVISFHPLSLYKVFHFFEQDKGLYLTMSNCLIAKSSYAPARF